MAKPQRDDRIQGSAGGRDRRRHWELNPAVWAAQLLQWLRPKHYQLVGADLLQAPRSVDLAAGDELAAVRSQLLHDPNRTAAELMKILLG